MKEAEIFESWASKLVEGTWAVPETPEQIDELKMWMSQPQPLGPDAEDVTDVLYDLIGDDALFDQLGAMAEEDPTADAVPLVQAWIDRNADRIPELAELVTALQQPTEPVAEPVPVEEPVAEPVPAEVPPPDQVAPVAEGDNPATFEEEVDEDTVSPRFAGLQQTQHDDGSKTTDYSMGPLQTTKKVDAQGRPLKTTASYDLGVGKIGQEQDHTSGIRTTTATPADPNADPNALMPTGAIAAAKGVDPKKFAAFQAQQPLKECNYTMENHYCPVHGLTECSDGIYETQLARLKLLSSLK